MIISATRSGPPTRYSPAASTHRAGAQKPRRLRCEHTPKGRRAEHQKLTGKYWLIRADVKSDGVSEGDGESPLRVKPGVEARYIRAVSSVKKRILMDSKEGLRLEQVRQSR